MGAKVLQASPQILWFLIPEVRLGEFLRGLVRKLIDAKLVLVTLCVLALNEVVSHLEILESLQRLALTGIVF